MDEALKLDREFSFDEYLELEETTQEKHDFYYGEVYNMAGGTKRHNEIVQEILFCFRSKIDKKKCKIYFENVKLELEKNQFYVYPDIMMTCDDDDLQDDSGIMIKNPSIIIEVLSKGTELYDRDTKKKHYLQLPSLKYYLLVAQNEMRIEMYEKINSHIEYSFYEHSEDIIKFKQFDFQMFVSEIYDF